MKKQSNLELLRIISMIMIIILHFGIHGGALAHAKIGTTEYYLLWLITAISYVSVNTYVLISGYFLCKAKFKLKRVIKIFLEVLFYSMGIYTIMVVVNIVPFNIKDGFKSVMPIISVQYWFVTRYMLMYICSPFINIFVNAMNKRQHITLIVGSTLLCCIIGLIVYAFNRNMILISGYSYIWFIFLYITAAYIRNYYTPNKKKIKKLVCLFFSIIMLFPIIKITGDYLLTTQIVNIISIDRIKELSNVCMSYSSLVVYTASILLFMIFLNINIRNKKINDIVISISSLTFGVYLIHDNNYIRPILWEFIKPYKYLDKWYFILFFITVVSSIFVICLVIEYIRKKIFEKLFKNNSIDIITSRLENEYNKQISRFIE